MLVLIRPTVKGLLQIKEDANNLWCMVFKYEVPLMNSNRKGCSGIFARLETYRLLETMLWEARCSDRT